ncbi:MAG: hypothetical protein WAX89_00815 [Alphaproteobacteria bacterium]
MSHMWPWVGFFIIQGLFPHYELLLLLLVLAILGYTFWLEYQQREWLLFAIGLTIGLVVEVGLGLFFRTQFWQYASLFGVPYWLPVVWGYGFVVMRRLGNEIVGEAVK